MKPVTSVLFYAFVVLTTFVAAKRQGAPIGNSVDYADFKKSVNIDKSHLLHHPARDIGNYLFKLIDEDIYTYWAGTPWDFHGTTQQPQEGSIACGYFVTTTLTDLGFNIDRVGLAEVASGVMIKKLCVGVRSFNGIANLDSYLAAQPVNSVFIVGLDFHTGYIVKNVTGCYFFHSNYIKKQGVVKEKVDESRALSTNKFFMIGSLTANQTLLRKWVTGKKII